MQDLQDVSKTINIEYKSKELLLEELREKDPKLV
jgi:hypothetical protein